MKPRRAKKKPCTLVGPRTRYILYQRPLPLQHLSTGAFQVRTGTKQGVTSETRLGEKRKRTTYSNKKERRQIDEQVVAQRRSQGYREKETDLRRRLERQDEVAEVIGIARYVRETYRQLLEMI